MRSETGIRWKCQGLGLRLRYKQVPRETHGASTSGLLYRAKGEKYPISKELFQGFSVSFFKRHHQDDAEVGLLEARTGVA